MDSLYEVVTTYQVKVKGVKSKKRQQVTNSEKMIRYFKKIYDTFIDADTEAVVALYFNVKLRPIAFKIISIGALDEARIPAKKVFRHALLLGASSFALCHNHPSGNATPSESDNDTTRKIKEIGNMLGIELIEHIILGDKPYAYSELWAEK